MSCVQFICPLAPFEVQNTKKEVSVSYVSVSVYRSIHISIYVCFFWFKGPMGTTEQHGCLGGKAASPPSLDQRTHPTRKAASQSHRAAFGDPGAGPMSVGVFSVVALCGLGPWMASPSWPCGALVLLRTYSVWGGTFTSTKPHANSFR